MESAMLLKTAAILLALTALGGLAMAVMRFTGAERPPSWLAMIHGLIAGSGLTLALYAGFTSAIAQLAWMGIGVLVLAALGGVYLNLAFHDKHIALPKGIVVGHAVIAVVGFGMFASAVFRG
jgi:hypothetical protein